MCGRISPVDSGMYLAVRYFWKKEEKVCSKCWKIVTKNQVSFWTVNLQVTFNLQDG